jgi:hypothetical protein
MDFIQTTLFKDTMDAVAHHGKVLWYGITIISYLLCLLRFYNEALQVDLFNSKGGNKIPPPPSNGLIPGWQEALQCSAQCL